LEQSEINEGRDANEMYSSSLSGTFSAVQKVIFMRHLLTERDDHLQFLYGEHVMRGQNDSI